MFVSDDPGFRDLYDPVFVGGEFPGSLDDGGETLALFDASGSLVDTVTYGTSSPWPWTAAGTGPSLELVDPAADNSEAANWAPSADVGGTPGRANRPDLSPLPEPTGPGVVLNEYNAVSDAAVLKNGGSDTYFGSIPGNGGNWFEVVVVEDGLDLRGWSFEWSDSTSMGILRFTDDPALASLPAGAIITVSDSGPEDATLDPAAGDWWMQLRAGVDGPGRYLVASPLEVSNSDWQLVVRQADGTVRFGPAGEGRGGLTGVGSDEVARLEEPPAASVAADSNYGDATASSFGSDTCSMTDPFRISRRCDTRVLRTS
ncbi:MAG: hypothetical protein R2715_06930 [Ilumatobacteraceae bacterium]